MENSKFDIIDIQNKFNKVLAYSQEGLENPKTDKLFADWYEAKKDIINALGGNLIYEVPGPDISFDLDESSKTDKLNNFIDLVDEKYQLPKLSKFIEDNRESFFSNQVLKTYMVYDRNECKDVKIPKGMKLLKAFKYFIEDETVLNEVQSVASMLIQENKITGRLCISVHPLDFLSSSENTHNWRSCHALDGEYRSGNISYMVDKTTFICYLKSNKEVILPDFPADVPWNSKKWRVLMFLDQEWKYLFAGRQYPFSTMSGIEYLKTVIEKVIFKNNNLTPWIDIEKTEKDMPKVQFLNHPKDTAYITRKPVYYNGGYIPIESIVSNGEGSLQYNDLLSSTCYIPIYSFSAHRLRRDFDKSNIDDNWTQNKLYKSPIPIIKVGGKCDCLRCNSNQIYLTESFMCDDCEMRYGSATSDIFATCPWCNERFIYDDGYWIENEDVMICPWCAEHEAVRCEHCDGLTSPNHYVQTSEDGGVYLCSCCYDNMDE